MIEKGLKRLFTWYKGPGFQTNSPGTSEQMSLSNRHSKQNKFDWNYTLQVHLVEMNINKAQMIEFD